MGSFNFCWPGRLRRHSQSQVKSHKRYASLCSLTALTNVRVYRWFCIALALGLAMGLGLSSEMGLGLLWVYGYGYG